MIIRTVGKTLFAGALGVGGVSMTKPGWLAWAGMDYMPGFHALSKDKEYASKESTYYSSKFGSKFGSKYRNYLVGIEKSNKAWWEWSYRRLKSDGISWGKFKVKGSGTSPKIDRAFSENVSDRSLNQMCDAAYKSSDSEYVFKELGGTEENTFKKSEAWKYCSPLGKEPTKVDKSRYSSGSIGSEEKDNNFVSTTDESNSLFWFIRDKEIKGEDDNFEKMLPKTTSSHFNQRYKTLRELCEEAYRSSPTGTNSPTKDETKKYCVFEIPAEATSDTD